MAKAPQPGQTKTRLCPPLLPEAAAELSAAFLRDITENIACAARHAPIYGCVAYAPAGAEGWFAGHLAAGTGLVLADGSPPMPSGVQGLGRCLLHAVQALLGSGYSAACLVNADSPTLPTAVLIQAARTLTEPGERVVLGPADDGGYYLLGMQRAHAELFADIPWSTSEVAAATRARAISLGLEVVTLPVWYDVDDAASLARLTEELTSAAMNMSPYQAPMTRACLARIGLLGPRTRIAAQ